MEEYTDYDSDTDIADAQARQGLFWRPEELLFFLVEVEEQYRPLVLDVRWSHSGPTGRTAYDAGHVPGAVYVDLETELSSPPGKGGRHPLPDSATFVAAMQRAGVRPGRDVVVYDDGPGTIASRLWWLLRDHGFDRVGILDGGLAEYVRLGGELSTDPVTPTPGDWTGTAGHLPVVDADGAAAVAREGLLLDVRAAERFRGETEPLDPVAGHIPGAVNAPLPGNVDRWGKLGGPDAIRARFEELGGVTGPVAVYCGSGVTATHTVLALRYAGIEAALYPGSWSGWIADPSRPVATGP